MTENAILTSGVHSEYVLGPLSQHLRHDGFNVVELDFGVEKGDVRGTLQRLSSQYIVYITSAHTNLSVRVAQQLVPLFAQSYPNYLCPLEIMPLIGKDVRTIYVPHDLLTPYGDTNLDEFRFLGLYDHILAPANAKALKATIGSLTTVHECGWIKYHSGLPEHKQLTRETTRARVSVFISMIEHLRLRLGLNGLVEYIRPLIKDGYQVKLPVWHHIDLIEDALRTEGINVIPSSANSIEVIAQSDLVICNGASSIHAEAAYMGKPTICLLGEEGISSSDQRAKLSHLRNISFLTHDQLRSFDPAKSDLLRIGRSVVPKKFDFPYISELVRGLFDDISGGTSR